MTTTLSPAARARLLAEARAEWPGRTLSAAVDAWDQQERERARDARKGAGR